MLRAVPAPVLFDKFIVLAAEMQFLGIIELEPVRDVMGQLGQGFSGPFLYQAKRGRIKGYRVF